MSDFKSTKEIWEYLISGGVIQTVSTDETLAIKVKLSAHGNILTEIKGEYVNGNWHFDCPSRWSKYIEEKPKKRFWIWDIQDMEGVIFRSNCYLDNNGRPTSGSICIHKELIRKHEMEYIEV